MSSSNLSKGIAQGKNFQDIISTPLQRMPPYYYFYILKCSDASFYVGSATNLENRLKAHNQGEGATFTAKRHPVQLVYHERFNRLDGALSSCSESVEGCRWGTPGKKVV
jgi:putative endonuclease